MKNLLILLVLTAVLLCGGCATAGLSADLLTCDVAEAVAVESKKALDAYDANARAASEKRQADMLEALSRDLVKIGTAKLDPNQAEAVAKQEVASLTRHLTNFAEQERRRQELYSAAADNLAYLIETAAAHRKFVLYRADIETQWKTYLEATARARLAKMKAPPATAPASK